VSKAWPLACSITTSSLPDLVRSIVAVSETAEKALTATTCADAATTWPTLPARRG